MAREVNEKRRTVPAQDIKPGHRIMITGCALTVRSVRHDKRLHSVFILVGGQSLRFSPHATITLLELDDK